MAGTTAATDPKETRLSIRTSDAEKRLLAEAASARRMTVSQFVLGASVEAAHAALADQTRFLLPPEQWEAFCERLDEPARAVPALVELFREAGPF